MKNNALVTLLTFLLTLLIRRIAATIELVNLSHLHLFKDQSVIISTSHFYKEDMALAPVYDKEWNPNRQTYHEPSDPVVAYSEKVSLGEGEEVVHYAMTSQDLHVILSKQEEKMFFQSF